MIFLLAIALLLPVPPIARPVHVVFVVPPGEHLTSEERASGVQSVTDATTWWQRHSPIPTELALTSTDVITLSGDVYTSLEWTRPYLRNANPAITIFIIDNTVSGRWLIGRDAVGESQDYYGVVWVVLRGLPGLDGLAATITHELGHVAYHLDDLPPGSVDIMRMPPTTAYHAGTVGCASLKALGQPCVRVYLPMTMRGQSADIAQARASDPPVAFAWVHDPMHLHPGQRFTVAAGVIGEASTATLDVPAWIEVERVDGALPTLKYQVRVRDGTPLDARGVITFHADGASSSFVVSLCCAEQRAPIGPRVLLPIVRR